MPFIGNPLNWNSFERNEREGGKVPTALLAPDSQLALDQCRNPAAG